MDLKKTDEWSNFRWKIPRGCPVARHMYFKIKNMSEKYRI